MKLHYFSLLILCGFGLGHILASEQPERAEEQNSRVDEVPFLSIKRHVTRIHEMVQGDLCKAIQYSRFKGVDIDGNDYPVTVRDESIESSQQCEKLIKKLDSIDQSLSSVLAACSPGKPDTPSRCNLELTAFHDALMRVSLQAKEIEDARRWERMLVYMSADAKRQKAEKST